MSKEKTPRGRGVDSLTAYERLIEDQKNSIREYRKGKIGFSILFFALTALYTVALAVYCILGGAFPGAVVIFLNIIAVAVQGGYFCGLAHDPN